MRKFKGNVLLSGAVHLLPLLLVLVAASHAPVVAPYRLPGTAMGVHLLTYYSPGAVAAVQSSGPLLPMPKHSPDRASTPVPSLQATATTASQAEKGAGTAAVSGLGNGEITMALQKIFPPPQPDLSSIAPGHHGEVILNAVIDEQGRIAQLTLLHGITPIINDTVIATVQGWTYQPATRNGVPVPSEQELHFYYERG